MRLSCSEEEDIEDIEEEDIEDRGATERDLESWLELADDVSRICVKTTSFYYWQKYSSKVLLKSFQTCDEALDCEVDVEP